MCLYLCAYIHALVQIKAKENIQILGLSEPSKFSIPNRFYIIITLDKFL